MNKVMLFVHRLRLPNFSPLSVNAFSTLVIVIYAQNISSSGMYVPEDSCMRMRAVACFSKTTLKEHCFAHTVIQ